MTENPYAPPSAPVSASYGSGDGQVSPLALQHLFRTQFWVRLISMVGLIGVSIWLITVLFAFAGFNGLMSRGLRGREDSGFFEGPVALIVVVVLFYLYPLIKLSKYASAIRRLRVSQSMADLEAALDQQRGFWRYVGIIVLLLAVCVILGLLGVFIALSTR